MLTLWIPTLEEIARAGYEELGNSLYAILVVQACAIIAAEPILLLTPKLVETLVPLNDLLQQCRFMESAQAVVRIFWSANRERSLRDGRATLHPRWESPAWVRRVLLPFDVTKSCPMARGERCLIQDF